MLLVPHFRKTVLPPHEGSAVFRVDFPDFLLPVYIVLVDPFNASPAPIIAAGAELAVNPTVPPQGLMHYAFPFFLRCVLNQERFHTSPPFPAMPYSISDFAGMAVFFYPVIHYYHYYAYQVNRLKSSFHRLINGSCFFRVS